MKLRRLAGARLWRDPKLRRRRDLLHVPDGKTPISVLPAIGEEIAADPRECCYFIDTRGLLFSLEVHPGQSRGEFAASIGVTERRFVELLWGPHVTVNEERPILKVPCRVLRSPFEALRFPGRSVISAQVFAAEIVKDAEIFLRQFATLRQIYTALLSDQLGHGQSYPVSLHRRSLHAAIAGFLSGAPWEQLLHIAKTSTIDQELECAASVERRLIEFHARSAAAAPSGMPAS